MFFLPSLLGIKLFQEYHLSVLAGTFLPCSYENIYVISERKEAFLNPNLATIISHENSSNYIL